MPRYARRTATVIVATVALLLAPSTASAGDWDHLLAPESACPGQLDATAPAKVQVRAMVCLHRYARAQNGLSGLHVVRPLKASAKKKAKDIKRCRSFSHEACGRDAFYWIKRMGFLRGPSGAGENLALGSGNAGSARVMMSSLLNSDGHRAVMLASKFHDLGVGVLRTKFGGYSGVQIWVVHFGYRR